MNSTTRQNQGWDDRLLDYYYRYQFTGKRSPYLSNSNIGMLGEEAVSSFILSGVPIDMCYSQRVRM
jgi:hypothetical protein